MFVFGTWYLAPTLALNFDGSFFFDPVCLGCTRAQSIGNLSPPLSGDMILELLLVAGVKMTPLCLACGEVISGWMLNGGNWF